MVIYTILIVAGTIGNTNAIAFTFASGADAIKFKRHLESKNIRYEFYVNANESTDGDTAIAEFEKIKEVIDKEVNEEILPSKRRYYRGYSNQY